MQELYYKSKFQKFVSSRWPIDLIKPTIALDGQHENIESVIHAPRALAPRGIGIGIHRREVDQGIGVSQCLLQCFALAGVLEVAEVAGHENGVRMGQRFGRVGEVGEGGVFYEDDARFARGGRGFFEEVAAQLGAEVAEASGDDDGAYCCVAVGGGAHYFFVSPLFYMLLLCCCLVGSQMHKTRNEDDVRGQLAFASSKFSSTISTTSCIRDLPDIQFTIVHIL